ncbi:sulfur carrier protein ThiS [Alkaliflexus imshenetskii]|uniref:sulfur carrier protein ThiS n=1 Tax=Alkaliflexus imshenetskii TaxID=286730 RepID=UPI00047DC553|nr:sulfur carrier protein ThiS [Alkaliflexus imshenetskii]
MVFNVNGEVREVDANTLNELVFVLGLPVEGVAVAVNGRIVLRSQWDDFRLQGGEEVMVIGATRGG